MRGWPLLLLLVLVLVLVPLAGCGVQPTGRIYAGDPAVARQVVPPTVVYFMRHKRLQEVQRPSVPGAPQAAIDQLVEGPTRLEYGQGIYSQVPLRAEVVVQMNYGEADLFYPNSEPWPDPPAQAQLVCTAGAQPGVHKVKLFLRGQTLDRSCASYPDLQPTTPNS